jgi:hypothetical protein
MKIEDCGVKGCPLAGIVEHGHVVVREDPGTVVVRLKTQYEPFQIAGPFLHHPGDDDSAAVTFWGKRASLETFEKAAAAIKKHYGITDPLKLELSEEDRQLVLLALAVLSLESPGFDDALNRIALRVDNKVKRPDIIEGDQDRAEVYDKFREIRRRRKDTGAPPW